MNIKNDSDCKEYNSLKYKTMIMTGTNIEPTMDTNEEKINMFLSMDMEKNKKGVWSKLSKTEKVKKIKNYIKTTLLKEHNLTEGEIITANKFFSLLMDRKKLSKNNELMYNQENGLIESIEGLTFNTETRKFTINCDKPQIKKRTVKNVTSTP
jgi:hypothetical protein|uniref:Uncharacterized protein n=1 Tax=viral metagenome TaxID=1070528 RepID=A0A6C0D1S2_9ZZZZ